MPNCRVLVLADDLTGAAEVAGAAAARGWRAEVWADPALATDEAPTGAATSTAAPPAELWVINTENRARSEAEASRRLAAVLQRLVCEAPRPPEAVFLKCDSLLRGHVAAELRAALTTLDCRAALLAPANPARGRVIIQGRYLVDGVPLAETLLARDPAFPRRSSSVADLLVGPALILGTAHWPAEPRGIVVPDIPATAALQHLAATAPADCLLAGGVEFFLALLDTRWQAFGPENAGSQSATPTAPAACQEPPPRLFVCGSLTAWRQGRAEACRRAEIPVVVAGDGAIAEVERALAERRTAFFAIGDPPAEPQHTGPDLLASFATQVAACQARLPQIELLVEGGETASAVATALKWRRFAAETQLAPGVVALLALDAAGTPLGRLVVKVGSYAWPATCGL